MVTTRIHQLITALIFISCFACQSNVDEQNKNDKLLAQVFNKSLFESELEGMILPETSPQDSALIVNSFVERWVRDNVLMHQAERSIPQGLKIDELVRDYRASLILHNYEKTLVELELDSTISSQALLKYYEENKEEYQLKSPILRCYFIKLARNTPDLNHMKNLWESDTEENYKKLIEYCSSNAAVYMLNDSIWYDKEGIFGQLPEAMVKKSKFRSGEKLTTQNEEYIYFLHILATKNKQDTAPLPYVSSRISRVILHHRKIKLLKDKREEMYERALRKNNIKMYIQ